jgi:glutamyl-tRNA synthetase
VFAHLPTVLNEQGEKMSKRNGAKAVTQYRDEGYLPDAMVNYLARLGWSHGDDEIFSRAQFLEWFNLDHLGRSAGQFDEAKLRWVNAQHLKAMDDAALAPGQALRRQGRCGRRRAGRRPSGAHCALFKDRCDPGGSGQLGQGLLCGQRGAQCRRLCQACDRGRHPVLDAFAAWKRGMDQGSHCRCDQGVLKAQGVKMPVLAMPVRVLTVGTAHTPSVDAVLELLGREKVIARLKNR